jgi:hypothetical protein
VFVDVGRPLWREVGSVVFSFCWASPAQSFSGLSPTGLMSIFYCLNFETPPTGRNKVAQLYSGLQVQVQAILRPTVSRRMCVGVGPPCGAHDQIFITVGHLRSSCCGAPKMLKETVPTVTTLLWRINYLVSPLGHSELWPGHPTNTSNEFWCVAI